MIRTTLTMALLFTAADVALAQRAIEPLAVEPGPSPFVAAQESGDDEREPGPATLEEAIEIAVKRYGGEPTRAETVEREGRIVHEIRLFRADGSVRTVRIDPDTGAIIPQRR